MSSSSHNSSLYSPRSAALHSTQMRAERKMSKKRKRRRKMRRRRMRMGGTGGGTEMGEED